MSVLDNIENPKQLKDLTVEELEILAAEIREMMIDTCAKNGGHIAPALGVVELTLALHRVFNTPTDKIIWDVGHQSYAHKIITGRKRAFGTLRTHKGISGFPKRAESPYDAFDTGHSSTSLSAALGMAMARDYRKEKYKVIAVIGDGSLGGGMAFEALNHIGQLRKDLIVILNDNERSIGESVGALAQYLSRVITTRTYNRLRDDIWVASGRLPTTLRDRVRFMAKRVEEGFIGLVAPSIIFEELGYRYIGPVNGHDIEGLMKTFSRMKELRGPLFVHVVTKKGKGFGPAEANPEKFHGIGCFDRATGETSEGKKTYTQVFGETMIELAQTNEKVVAITAGMCLGTGLVLFREKFPNRFFDVGIAEQHAVTMASALALEGFRPVCAVYSTFLQRAYDQIIHDVALQNLPVVFAIDRAGLVGEDGPTHHGPFDLAYLRVVPNLVIMAPSDEDELRHMLYTAIDYRRGPVAIRYPRDQVTGKALTPLKKLTIGKAEVIAPHGDVTIIAVGTMVHEAMHAREELEKSGIKTSVINARFVKPLDEELITTVAHKTKKIFTVEEGAAGGGFGSGVLELLSRYGLASKVRIFGLPDQYIEHGERRLLLSHCGLTGSTLAKKIKQEL